MMSYAGAAERSPAALRVGVDALVRRGCSRGPPARRGRAMCPTSRQRRGCRCDDEARYLANDWRSAEGVAPCAWGTHGFVVAAAGALAVLRQVDWCSRTPPPTMP